MAFGECYGDWLANGGSGIASDGADRVDTGGFGRDRAIVGGGGMAFGECYGDLLANGGSGIASDVADRVDRGGCGRDRDIVGGGGGMVFRTF